MGRKRRGFRGGVYLIRTRKPNAPLGLSLRWVLLLIPAAAGALHLVGWPIWLALALVVLAGRHNGYVGLTNSYVHRERQHLQGGGTYRVQAKDWADLEPRFWRILPLPDWRWLLEAAESLLIALLLPVYNVKKQAPWNLRKISLKTAARQRRMRDRHGLAYKVSVLVARWVIIGAVFALSIYAAYSR